MPTVPKRYLEITGSDILTAMFPLVSFRTLLLCLAGCVVGLHIARGQGFHGINPENMDRRISVSKPEQMYEYANGGWLARNSLPSDKSYIGTFDEINERNLNVLKTVAEEAAGIKPHTNGSSPTELVGILYRLAMNERNLNAAGAAPLAAQLRRIDLIHDRESLIDEIAHLQALAVGVGFTVDVEPDDVDSSRVLLTLSQGGQTLPDRQMYLDPDHASVSLRRQYVLSISQLMRLANMHDPLDQANKALFIETQLAKASATPVELRDPKANYHLLSAAALKEICPLFGSNIYFHRLGTVAPATMNVRQPKFFTAFSQLIESEPLTAWKAYLRATALFTWAPYLSDSFVNARFTLSQALTGTTQLPPRWKRAVQTIDSVVGEALGQLYVAKAFPESAKQIALNLVRNLKLALRDRISDLEWMSPKTQTLALKKLEAITVKVGYPDKWRSYEGLKLRRDFYVLSIMKANVFEWNRQLSKLGKPVDKGEWSMTPPTVNAYYNPSWNEIVFPAGILQPGFFDPAADEASNYGAIGAIIGHEISHGFDDQGAQYDAKGNLANWWTPEDKLRFDDAAATIVAQYSGYKSPAGYPVNGKLTLGENIADVGGLTIAYLAYQKAINEIAPPLIDGLTGEQRFFIAFAQNYKARSRPQAEKVAVATDPHSPDAVRVVGAISDQIPFYKAFGLKPPLHVPHIW